MSMSHERDEHQLDSNFCDTQQVLTSPGSFRLPTGHREREAIKAVKHKKAMDIYREWLLCGSICSRVWHNRSGVSQST
jgi:hypothetical protein